MSVDERELGRAEQGLYEHALMQAMLAEPLQQLHVDEAPGQPAGQAAPTAVERYPAPPLLRVTPRQRRLATTNWDIETAGPGGAAASTTPAPGKTFWVVYRQGGSSPTQLHSSEQTALTEASRLATSHPGLKFHVLKLVATAAVGGQVNISRPVDVSDGL